MLHESFDYVKERDKSIFDTAALSVSHGRLETFLSMSMRECGCDEYTSGCCSVWASKENSGLDPQQGLVEQQNQDQSHGYIACVFGTHTLIILAWKCFPVLRFRSRLRQTKFICTLFLHMMNRRPTVKKHYEANGADTK